MGAGTVVPWNKIPRTIVLFWNGGLSGLNLQIPKSSWLRVTFAGLVLAAALGVVQPMHADATGSSRLAQGKQLATTRSKGNCLACHVIEDGELPGTIGPPLVYMQQRYPDRAQLRAQIWDPTVRNPDTVMPPFGKHEILSEEEIDLVVDYIHSL